MSSRVIVITTVFILLLGYQEVNCRARHRPDIQGVTKEIRKQRAIESNPGFNSYTRPDSNVPIYGRKPYYTESSCHFGECREYRFLCGDCPHPRIPGFSVGNVRRHCINCYYIINN